MLPPIASPPPRAVADCQAIIAAGRRGLLEAERSLQAMRETIEASRQKLAVSYRLLRS